MMFFVAVLCISIGLVNSQAYTYNTCGLRPINPDGEKDFDKIVGGAISIPGDWPWSCSMRLNGNHICGGSLISDHWIIGAAHCVSNAAVNNPSSITWACGIHIRTQPASYTQIFSTLRAIRHPQYNAQKIQNDIAIFELTTYATLTDYVLPVCIPNLGEVFTVYTCVATGWGSTFSGGGVSLPHREVSMPVLTDDRCEERFDGSNNMIDPPTQVCAGEEGENKDTCQGDSGGPLVVKETDGLWYCIGLTSWGYGCGDGGIYTRTSAYKDWIEGFTGALPTGV